MNILKLNGLTKNFFLHNANRKIHSCRNISFTLDEGKFLGIVGRSGAGKSTLIKLMLKELEPTTGRIIINGKDLKKIKHRKIPREHRRTLGGKIENESSYLSRRLRHQDQRRKPFKTKANDRDR